MRDLCSLFNLELIENSCVDIINVKEFFKRMFAIERSNALSELEFANAISLINSMRWSYVSMTNLPEGKVKDRRKACIEPVVFCCNRTEMFCETLENTDEYVLEEFNDDNCICFVVEPFSGNEMKVSYFKIVDKLFDVYKVKTQAIVENETYIIVPHNESPSYYLDEWDHCEAMDIGDNVEWIEAHSCDIDKLIEKALSYDDAICNYDILNEGDF